MKDTAPPSPDSNDVDADVEARRTVLRGVFLAGCSALVPGSLIGCGRQESDQADTAAPGDAPPSPAGEAPAPGAGTRPGTAPGTAPQGGAAPAKVSQASVQYQDRPKGAQKCGNCIQFLPPNACKVVEGEINPEGWCAIWVGQT